MVRPYHDSAEAAADAYARDPEGQAAAGLAMLLLAVLRQAKTMLARNTHRLRLMTEVDAVDGGQPCARAANLTSFLAGAFLNSPKHRHISFDAPKERTSEERALLRAVVRHVYENFSEEAYAGLDLLADANTHFGGLGGRPSIVRASSTKRARTSIRRSSAPRSSSPVSA